MILAGGIRDEQAAAALSRTGARAGDVFDLDGELGAIASGLGESVRVDVPIEVEGATWFHPHTVASLRPGTQVMVFARMASPASSFAVTIGGSRRTAEVIRATPALLERAAARAEIDELEAALAATTAEAAGAKLRKQIEQRSVAARVVSSQATMLVLDTDGDYARYGIDRRALADILVVGPHGLEQSHRTFVASKDPPRQRPRAQPTREELIEQARGAEALAEARYGTIGHGSGAGGSWGSGHGAMRARVAAVPTVSLAMPLVAAGALDKTIIRRYIKRHIAKITYCYEHELLGRPHLQGTLQTQLTIGPTGRVLAATATGVDEKVATCVAGVLRDIEFPPVSDSTVVVNYPFTFRTPGSPATVEPSQPAAVAAQQPAPAISTSPGVPDVPAVPAAPPPVAAPPAEAVTPPVQDEPSFGPTTSALDGKLARVMNAIGKQDAPGALALAKTWRDEQPTDVLALVGRGEAFEASGDRAAAARAGTGAVSRGHR